MFEVSGRGAPWTARRSVSAERSKRRCNSVPSFLFPLFSLLFLCGCSSQTDLYPLRNGTVETANFSRPSTASLNQQTDNIQVGTRRYDAIKATVALSTGSDSYELITWYAKGLGPIRQEQRTDGKLDYKVELLSGP